MPAPDRDPPFNISQLAFNPVKGIVGHYSAAEIDALLADAPAGGEGSVDLTDYAKTEYVDATKAEIIAAVTPALAERYTKPEVDGLLSDKIGRGDFDNSNSYFASLHNEVDRKLDLLNGGFQYYAEKKDVYTKPEVDEAIAASISGQLSPAQIEELISQVGPVDLTDYAKLDSYSQEIIANAMKAQAFTFTKSGTTLGYARTPEKQAGHLALEVGGPGGKVEYIAYESGLTGFAKKDDNTQNIIANAMVAKGYAFGDSVSDSNTGLVYTDTGEGYGPRLVLGTPSGNELIPYQSDFEPIKARLNTLESKGAPTVDLSTTASKESVDLLRSQLQAIFDGVYTRPESDARYVANATLAATQQLIAAEYATKASVYTKNECDTKFLTLVDLGIVVQKGELTAALAPYVRTADVNTAMAAFATRAYVDQKYNTVYPTGAVTINDPGMADFKKSVLDAVALMIAGGTKQPPADIGWTKCSPHPTAEVRLSAGMLEFRGVCGMSAASGFNSLFTYPSNFPLPADTVDIPVAARLVGSNVVAAYVWFKKTDRTCGISAAGTINEYNLGSVRLRAAY